VSIAKYPRYRDSGAKWLGELPSHWEVKRLKQICHAFPSNVDKKSYADQEPVKLCNYVDVYYNGEITADLAFMEATASQEEIAKFTLVPGDVVITKDSETAGDIAIAAYVPEHLPGVVCGYHLTIVRPSSGISGRYVKRLFDSRFLKAQFQVSANGLTRVGLSQYAIDNALMIVPPFEEQTAIATFLERETGKIDALVAEQEKLIELLKEKRQSVISHAVTKGLNPNAPMKDSGIEWLGEVPAHWNVVPAKRVAAIFVPQRNKPELNSDGEGLPWVTMEEMRSAMIAGSELSVSPDAAKAAGSRVLPAGAVVASCVGNFGVSAITTVDVIINQQLQAYLIFGHLRAEFLRLLLSVSGAYFEMVGTASTLTYVNQEGFANLPVPLPSKEEQDDICRYLSDQCARCDVLVLEAGRAIDLLKEHRSALISAAVTGKIDVRGMATPRPDQEALEPA
jgi:type I restriction enzyme S subunit